MRNSFESRLSRRLSLTLVLACAVTSAFSATNAKAESLDADLLIVGGNESACAAAVQAARLGVKRIVLVNDIEWLGGQFSAEGVGCLDEWTTVQGKRVSFPHQTKFIITLLQKQLSQLIFQHD